MTNFNLNANSFYAYMRSLAAEHIDIGKDLPDENRKHFFQGELEDFYRGLNSAVLFPALVVEGFQLNITAESPQQKFRESAFTVVMNYADHDNYQQQTECFSQSEDIGLEILRRMMQDADAADCVIRISDISGVPIQNSNDRYCGIRFSFTLSDFFETEIDLNKWQEETRG